MRGDLRKMVTAGGVDVQVIAGPGDVLVMARRATNDEQLLGFWTGTKTIRTAKEYGREAAGFLAFLGKPLPEATLYDVFDYLKTREHLAPATQARTINALKSLVTFAFRAGYVRADIMALVRQPRWYDDLSERIVDEADIHRIINLAEKPKERLLLLLAYASGGRISELCRLRWRECRPRDDAGQIALYGKGERTRVVMLSARTWAELEQLRGQPDEYVLATRTGKRLHRSYAWRVVKRAAARAGIDEAFSPHWFRHAHASHALERGAPLPLVQATLGHSSVATTGKYLHARPTESSGRYLRV